MHPLCNILLYFICFDCWMCMEPFFPVFLQTVFCIQNVPGNKPCTLFYRFPYIFYSLFTLPDFRSVMKYCFILVGKDSHFYKDEQQSSSGFTGSFCAYLLLTIALYFSWYLSSISFGIWAP